MPTVINPAQLTFNGKEISQMSELIFERAFINPALTDFMSVITGIVAKEQIGFIGQFGLMGKKWVSCPPASDANTLPISEKYWNPANIFSRIELCWSDLIPSFLIWGQKKGVNRYNLQDTDFMRYLIEKFAEAQYEAALRIAFFGDTTAAVAPGGYLTAGTDPLYFTMIDGIWVQLFAIVTANAARKTTTLSAKNGQATAALQAFNAADVTAKIAINTFQQMLQSADTRLQNQPDLVFITTNSVYWEYLNELNSFATYITPAYQNIQDGRGPLQAMGIPIVPFAFEDRIIQAYENNGTKLNLPHRVILTTRSNLAIGIEETGQFKEFDIFIDKVKKETFMDAQWYEDSKVLEDSMVQVAY